MNTSFVTSATASSASRRAIGDLGSRAGRLLTGALLVGLGLPAGGAAQEIDAGQLQLLEDGRRVGVERFRIWRAGQTVNAVANIDRPQGEEWQVGIQMDADLVPLKYGLQEGRRPLVSGDRYADRVRFHTASPEGERWKEFPPSAVGAIVEVGVAHHYFLLLHVLRAGGDGLSAIVPTRGERVDARLVGEADDRVSVGDRTVTATRYDLDIGDDRVRVWVDAQDKLLRVANGSGFEAVRLPPRG